MQAANRLGGWLLFQREQGLELLGIELENRLDDVFLVAEMVVKIPWAHTQIGRYMVGGDILLTPLVKQLDRSVDDSIFCLHE